MAARRQRSAPDEVTAGALPAENLAAAFPPLPLPIQPPYPLMEARTAETIPRGDGWQYEPKWDGFRCLVFRDGEKVELQSKAGKPLTRYFPDVVASAKSLVSTFSTCSLKVTVKWTVDEVGGFGSAVTIETTAGNTIL